VLSSRRVSASDRPYEHLAGTTLGGRLTPKSADLRIRDIDRLDVGGDRRGERDHGRLIEDWLADMLT